MTNRRSFGDFRIRTVRDRRGRDEGNDRRDVHRPETGRRPVSEAVGRDNIRPMSRDRRRRSVREEMPFDPVPGAGRVVLPFARSVRPRMSIVRGVRGLEIAEPVPVFVSRGQVVPDGVAPAVF